MTADQALAAIVETIDALREAEFQRAMTEGGHVPVAPLAPRRVAESALPRSDTDVLAALCRGRMRRQVIPTLIRDIQSYGFVRLTPLEHQQLTAHREKTK